MRSLLARRWAIRLRNNLRQNSLAQMIYQRWMAARTYEQRFGDRLLSSVGPSTYVWDIGANVGLYTQQILDRGARHVIACV